jgi:conjugal transfer pilus assembly protein TraF
MKKILYLMVILNASQSCADSFYKDKKRGWYWFEQKKEEKIQEEQEELTQELKIQNSREKLERLQKKLEDARIHSVMSPTVENVTEYIRLQRIVLDKAAKFEKTWKLALLKDPSLNDTIKNPINNNAIRIADEIKQQEKQVEIEKFAQNYGLIYVYAGRCKFCTEFAPILKEFAENYKFSVAALPVDGSKNSEFATTENLNLIKHLQIKTTPSVFAYSPRDNKVLPLGTGFMSEGELATNVMYLIEYLKKKQAIEKR